MKAKHDIDTRTFFCRTCGQSAVLIRSKGISCTTADNVVAISHIVRFRTLNTLALPKRSNSK